jgi:F420-non-reducing hydrogenase small subunit
MAIKPKLSVYWSSSCGGCEIALVNLHEKLLEVDRVFDFVFCPCLLDTKKAYIESLPDRGIAITFFNGAVRTSENEEMARLLRAKSEVLVAFGACSGQGGIPALSNLHGREAHMLTNYVDSPALRNPSNVRPHVRTLVPEGELELPEFFDVVQTLEQTVPVDYFIPGCPPEPHQIWAVIETVIAGKALPPKGSTLGGGRSTVCEECRREKENKRVARFYRTYEVSPSPDKCLLEQGVVCMGIATRDGCGALCPQVNMPCTGCYGPPEGVLDQGSKMLTALGSILDPGEYKGMSERQLAEKTDAIVATIPDLAGTVYKFSMAGSALHRRDK